MPLVTVPEPTMLLTNSHDRGVGNAFSERFGSKVVQQLVAEAQERDDLCGDAVLRRPLRPIVEVDAEVEMHEPVGERRGHAVDDAAVALAVAGRDDGPAVGQLVFAELAVEDQLIARGLGQLRRRHQLVQEQDALALAGQELGHRPMGAAVAVDVRQAAQVDGIEQDGADVAQLEVALVRDLLDDRRLADAGRTPDHDRLLDADQDAQGLGHL